MNEYVVQRTKKGWLAGTKEANLFTASNPPPLLIKHEPTVIKIPDFLGAISIRHMSVIKAVRVGRLMTTTPGLTTYEPDFLRVFRFNYSSEIHGNDETGIRPHVLQRH